MLNYQCNCLILISSSRMKSSRKYKWEKKMKKQFRKLIEKKKENEMKIPFLKLKGNQMNFFFLLAHAVIWSKHESKCGL